MSTPDGPPTPGPGGSYPPPGEPGAAPYLPPPAQILVTIGDISCTQTELLIPTGRVPLRGTTWTFSNQSTVTQKIPTWAVVVAVVGLLVICVLSLLFLLVKERTVQGSVQVTVHGPGVYYATNIAVTSEAQVADLEARVNYARSLVSALG